MSYWKDKVIVITGGSSGLGLCFARELVARGAKVAIVARDEAKLADAASQLAATENVACLPADITSQSDVDALPGKVLDAFGSIDALINCAGKSERGELLKTTPQDFQQLWELNFLAMVRCTQAFAPSLKETKGHVVNIGSLASKLAAKYLGAYAASKFPVAAFSQQLRLEAEGHFHVLLVCPGPMARSDAGVRYDDSNVPAEAKQPGGGVRIKGLDPIHVVESTLNACERRKAELILPRKAKLLIALSAVSPSWGDWLLKKFTS